MEWSTACPDWERRILAGESLVPCAPLFPNRAEEALHCFKQLQIVDVLDSPTFGEASREWVFDFVAAIFGAYDRKTRRQLIRYFLLLISKKNSKSTIAGGIGLTWLFLNTRPYAEGIILAPTIEVAENSFKPMLGAINADDELGNLFHINASRRIITHKNENNRSTLKVLAADSQTVSGKKASLVIVDELWDFGQRGNAEAMFREATGGLASRPEGLVVYLSTQSDKPPAGIFAKTLDEFRGIRDGRIVDPRSMPVIYEYPRHMVEQEAFRDPDTWYITNPNLDASVDRQYLLEQLGKAELSGESSLRGFFAKHLNVEIGISIGSNTWAGAQYWQRGVDRSLALDELLIRCEVITIGIDGGGLDDLLGLCVLGRERETRRWLAWHHAFISPEGMGQRKINAAIYSDFIEDGDLTLVDELPHDLDELVAIVKTVKDSGLLAMVGIDAIGLPTAVEALASIGITQDAGLLTGVGQGISLMGTIKSIERKLIDGTFKHDGSRMMAWCAGNAKVVRTPTAMRIARDESGAGKIDPLMALFDAAQEMARDPTAHRDPEYQMFFLGKRKAA